MPREEAGLQARSLPQTLKGAIYLRLERADEADGRLVVEGENLGEKDAAHALRPVDPEVGVGEAGPREAARGAAGGRLLHVDEEAQSPLLAHAGEELHIARQARHGRLHHTDLQGADVVLSHGSHGLRLQHLSAVDAASEHDHACKGDVVACRAIEPASAHMELRILGQAELDGRQAALLVALVHAGQPRALAGGELERGVLHAERAHDVLLKVAIELLAARRLHHLARPVDVDPVLPAIARLEEERGGERLVRTGGDSRRVGGRLVLRDGRAPDLVAVAGGVGEEVTQRDGAPRLAKLGFPRRIEAIDDTRRADLGHYLARGLVEAQLSLLHELHGGGGGEGLRHRGDPHDRVECHGGRFAELSDAEGFFVEGALVEKAFGVRELGKPAPMTLDTVVWIASMTKALTATAAMQLVEKGKLSLDQPAREVVPEVGAARVIDGFDAAGKPKLR